MKSTKGFTLAELIGVIVILGVIMIVAAPNMTKQIKKKETTDQTILDEKIYNATLMYAAKYYADDIVNSKEFSFKLSDLVDDGLLALKGKCDKVENPTITYSNSGGYNFYNIKDSDCASDNIGK